MKEDKGGHGGGDAVLLDEFSYPPPDRYIRAADGRAGAASILTGIAANHSTHTGKPIQIADLAPGLKRPDHPVMPANTDAVPMPPRG